MGDLSIKQGLTGLVFETGYKVAQEKGLAIVWMSVGNSYFGWESIKKIVSFVTNNFKKTKFLIPFEPTINIYKALGYDGKKATTKAGLWSNRLTNHTWRIVGRNTNLNIVDWKKEIANNPLFWKQLQYLKDLYKDNVSFTQDADKTTENMLKEKAIWQIDLQKGIKIGVQYILEELAFLLASPEIFNIFKTVCINHKRLEIFEKLVNGAYDWIPKPHNWFLLIK